MRFLIFALVLTTFSSTAMAKIPEIRKVPIVDVYIPLGFDTNDNTEIIISGYLPNLCHQHPMTEVEYTPTGIHIVAKTYYYEPTNPFCPGIKQIPFVTTVSLGLLEPGRYEITVNDNIGANFVKYLVVNPARSGLIDDSIYANTEYIEEHDYDRSVDLVARNFVDCFRLKEIKTVFSGNTLSILPVLEQFKPECRRQNKIVRYKYIVPKKVGGDKEGILLHVRRMDGRSINHLFRSRL